jgi:PAS domain S-box-containing protein
MQANKTELKITPKFTAADIEILKKYYHLNLKYFWQISNELTQDLARHPLWGPIIATQTPEQRKAENERSLELQRAAIFDGKWDEYTEQLIVQGTIYARMNVSYMDWYELIKMYKDYLLPYIRKDFSDSASNSLLFMEGLTKLIDYAMYGIAEAYFAEKNNIIKNKEERFRAIFENSSDYIYIIDKTAIISMINRTSEGVSKDEILGKSLIDFYSDEDKVSLKSAMKNVFIDKKPSFYISSIKTHHPTSYFASSMSPIFSENGQVDIAVIITRDVTHEKNAENEIRELNESLEKKVELRTEELNNSNKELESFSYTVTHDLKSPLRAINSYSKILENTYSESGDPNTLHALRRIIENILKMGQLIDDLLEFSRLGRLNITKTEVDMNTIVKSIILELKEKELPRAIEFRLKPLNKITGDEGLLKQVIFNLLSNAVKYTGKKEKAVIEIGNYEENTNQVYYIKDNGVGFNMEYYDKLFEVFQRLHSLGEFEGTGVGLAIVKRIITKHAGKVWAEGKVDAGATFFISLPIMT